MRQFMLTQEFPGYNNKEDNSKLSPGVLVSGSKNVYSIDGLKVASRPGYTILGASNSALTPIESSYDWTTSGGVERNLRCYDDKIEVYYDGAWLEIADSFTSVAFNWEEWWNSTEIEDEILFCNGTTDLFIWNGAIAEVLSVTSNTITKSGTATWLESRFYNSGNKKVMIDGVEYTYTGGESTTTLTGVTPDPSAGGVVAEDVATQSVVTESDLISSSYNIDILATVDSQLWVGSHDVRTIWVSAVNDYTDFTFSANRVVGEGALMTLDSTPKGFEVQDNYMYVSAGKGFWYQSNKQLSGDNVNEVLTVNRLKSGPQQGAISQSSIGKIKNDTVFISHEPTLDFLGNIENVSTAQSTVMSDPIKNDFNTYNFGTNTHLKYFRNNLYVAIPNESILLIYNIQNGYWEAPWYLPAGRLAIIDDELYLHSNAVPETYKLFDGYNDNGNSINAIAKFAYNNFGARTATKDHTEWYTEGYVTTSTVFDLDLDYDYKGYSDKINKPINGSDSEGDVILKQLTEGSLGKESLGKEKLGGTSSGDDINKFRVIHEIQESDYYEIGPIYSSDGIDLRWEILAFGADAQASTYDNSSIKR